MRNGLKKGKVSAMFTTLLVVATAVAVVLIALFANLFGMLAVDRPENTFEFVRIIQEPYSMVNIIDNTKSGYGNRQLLEQAIETVAVNSSKNAQLDVSSMKFVLDSYGFEYYYVDIIRADRIFELESGLRRCGQNNEGICETYQFLNDPDPYMCGVGWQRIDDDDKCRFYQRCCEYTKQATGSNTIKKCGGQRIEDKVGICTNRLGINLLGNQLFGVPACGNRAYEIPDVDKDCEAVNSGKTPVCCVAKEEDTLVRSGLASSAEIPLFYKDIIGYMSVTLDE